MTKNPARRTVDDPELGSALAAARVGFVDVLRFIASSCVVAQHLMEKSSVETFQRLTVFNPGLLGVVLFFLVSGYVMPLSVRRGFVPVDFALRRIFRIYPAVLVAFALLAVVALFKPNVADIIRGATIKDWAANIFLVHEFAHVHGYLGVTWTLILEFAWYTLFGVAIYFAPRHAPTFLARGGHVMVLALTILSLAIHHRIPLGRVGMIYAAIIGMQAYRYAAGILSRRDFILDATLFVVLMAAANTVAFGIYRHPITTWAGSFWPWMIAPALFFATLIPAVRDSAFFRSRTLAWFGAISLSLYLLHPVAMGILGPSPFSGPTMLAIAALTVAMSAVVYYVVERPGIELGRRVSGRLAPRIAAEAV